MLTPEALAVLPTEWIITMKHGVERGDVELLLSTIEQIRGRNPALADILARLVNNFEYDEILRWLQETKSA